MLIYYRAPVATYRVTCLVGEGQSGWCPVAVQKQRLAGGGGVLSCYCVGLSRVRSGLKSRRVQFCFLCCKSSRYMPRSTDSSMVECSTHTDYRHTSTGVSRLETKQRDFLQRALWKAHWADSLCWISRALSEDYPRGAWGKFKKCISSRRFGEKPVGA